MSRPGEAKRGREVEEQEVEEQMHPGERSEADTQKTQQNQNRAWGFSF
jgi:hypothetical protein